MSDRQSNGLLLGVRRTMKYFDVAAKIHAGADANQKIYFHRPLRRELLDLSSAKFCFILTILYMTQTEMKPQ